jgi:hypothetical protein
VVAPAVVVAPALVEPMLAGAQLLGRHCINDWLS